MEGGGEDSNRNREEGNKGTFKGSLKEGLDMGDCSVLDISGII